MARASAQSLKESLLSFKDRLIGLRRWANPLASPHAPANMRNEINRYVGQFRGYSDLLWCYLEWLETVGGNPLLPDDFDCPIPPAPEVPPPPPPPPGGNEGPPPPPHGDNLPPIADAGGPYGGLPGTAITVDGSGTVDPNSPLSALMFSWAWGDGTPPAEGVGRFNPQHTYAVVGDYTIVLTVTDPQGLSDTDTTTASISASAIPPEADPDGPYTVMVNQTLVADGTRSTWDPRWTIDQITWHWDWGDGQFTEGTGTAMLHPGHVYTSVNTYTISLELTDPAGGTDTGTTTVQVTAQQNRPPVACFTGPLTRTVGQSGTWDATCTADPTGDGACSFANSAMTFRWNFGDGTAETTAYPTVSHTYSAAGTCTLQLRVTEPSPCNLVGTTQRSVVVSALPPTNEAPTAILTGPTQVNANQQYTWDGSGSHDNGSNPTPPGAMLYTYNWGDGTANTSGVGRTTATHTYTVNNVQRIITLTVDDQHPTNPLTGTDTLNVQVGTPPPESPCSGCSASNYTNEGINAWDGWCVRSLSSAVTLPGGIMGFRNRTEGQRGLAGTCNRAHGRRPETAGSNYVYADMELKADPGWIDAEAAGLEIVCGGGQHFVKIGRSPLRCCSGGDEPSSIRFDISLLNTYLNRSDICLFPNGEPSHNQASIKNGFGCNIYSHKNSVHNPEIGLMPGSVPSIINSSTYTRVRFVCRYEPTVGRMTLTITYRYGTANPIVKTASATRTFWQNIPVFIGDNLGWGNCDRHDSHGYVWIRNLTYGRLD